MTRWVRTLRVLVKEAAARGEIQQRGAGQYRQRAMRRRSSENRTLRVHKRHFSLALWTGGEASWLQLGTKGERLTPLTAQPIRPKLRLSKYMPVWTDRARILVLLLGIIFLAAQFHFCADLTVTSSASHFCPTCSTVGSVVATQTPGIAMMPITDRLELPLLVASVFSAVPRATSPRAPPSL